METRCTEIAPGIYRLSTYVAEIGPPAGFTFNQFLVEAEQSLLFHCGMRSLFPAVSAALNTILPIEKLRWISFGHVEADECGAMNQWLAAAPLAEVAVGALGCDVSVRDLADRPPRSLADGEVLDLGDRRVRYFATPHVPHGWDAGLLFEESTATLLCGDMFTHLGAAVLTEGDIVGPAIAAERTFMATAITPATAPTLRRLSELNPRTLALMHGASFNGDGRTALRELADYYQQELLNAAGCPPVS
jgi:flavorubredoxin